MNTSTRDYIRSQPQPTAQEALDFARSVMIKHGVDVPGGPYTYTDGLSLAAAKVALEAYAVDVSEMMALEMIDYALEGVAV